MGVCVKLGIHSRGRSREQFFVKFTYFATLILRKVKEIGLIATTRFEDLDLNCVIGWFKKIWDRLMTSL